MMLVGHNGVGACHWTIWKDKAIAWQDPFESITLEPSTISPLAGTSGRESSFASRTMIDYWLSERSQGEVRLPASQRFVRGIRVQVQSWHLQSQVPLLRQWQHRSQCGALRKRAGLPSPETRADHTDRRSRVGTSLRRVPPPPSSAPEFLFRASPVWECPMPLDDK